MSQSTQQPPGWGPTPNPSPRPRKRRISVAGWIGITIGALILLGIIGAIAGGNDTASVNTTSPVAITAATAKPKADASTQLSCEHFRNVMGDIGNGLLTESELRDKTKQFYDTGRLSDWPRFRTIVSRMLAAITAGDTDAYIAAAEDMSTACDVIGE